jgi:hypothetical protein
MTGATGSPAPWDCRLEAVVWWHRARPEAAAALPPPLRGRRLPVTLAGLIRYRDSPVGPYREVVACPMVILDGLVPTGHVPFIAVDSPASLHAGRENWALPKVPASFPGAPGAAAPASWSVAARVRARRRRLPIALAARCLQVDPTGALLAFWVLGAGLAAPARARVQLAGPERPAWLGQGDHPALVLAPARVRIGRAYRLPSGTGSPSMLARLYWAW